MAERSIHRVRVTLGGETVELPWASRDLLLDQLRTLDSMRPVVDSFEAVGTSRPVVLKHQQKVALLQVIEAWGGELPLGLLDLPEGISELCAALDDDLQDDPGADRVGGGVRGSRLVPLDERGASGWAEQAVPTPPTNSTSKAQCCCDP